MLIRIVFSFSRFVGRFFEYFFSFFLPAEQRLQNSEYSSLSKGWNSDFRSVRSREIGFRNWLCFFNSGFVKCRFLGFPASCLRFPAEDRQLGLFGFVFLASKTRYLHIIFSNRTLRQFDTAQIGFVFSNRFSLF